MIRSTKHSETQKGTVQDLQMQLAGNRLMSLFLWNQAPEPETTDGLIGV